MHIPEPEIPDHETASTHAPLARRWHRIRAAYRYFNVASHHILGFTVKFALTVYLLFALLCLVLRYAILPNIDYYKGDIEKMAGQALGNPVSIARIYASWQGLRPNLFLGDVVLRDREGRAALSLPSVSATLSWWTLLSGKPQFESLELIRPSLDVRREADGKLSVAGIVLEPTKSDGADNDWLLRQREVVIREGQVRWTDLSRGAPELVLDKVGLVLRNRWNRHQLAVRATPPALLSSPIELRADFTHPHFAVHIADLALWKGELYTDVRDTDLAAWKDYVDYPFQIAKGHGAVRAWITLDQARLAGFTADVGLSGVSAMLGKQLPPLELAHVAGRISAREQFGPRKAIGTPTFGAYGHQLALTDFSLETVDGLKLPASTVSESYTPAVGAKPERIALLASELDLATLAKLAGQLPLSPAERDMLRDVDPRGRVRDFSLEWQGRFPAIAAYRVKGKFDALAMQAQPARAPQPKTAHSAALPGWPAIPGFSNLSGSIDASDKGGRLNLDAQAMVLQVPAWFADPALRFDTLAMQARWSNPKPDQILVEVDSFEFAQGKLHGKLSGKHLMPLAGPSAKRLGAIDLDGTLGGFEIGKIDQFLPLQTPPELRRWLTGALLGGMLQDVTLKLHGDLAQFPFRADHPAEHGAGQFRIAGRIEDGTLNYAPSHFAKDGVAPLWPLAEGINGTILFDSTRMEIKSPNARTAGVALTNVKAVVPDLSSHDMQLEIDGSAAGPMQLFLQYVAASPVLDWIGRFTEDTKASGNAKLALKLRLPLARLPEAKVLGTLQLINNDVVLFDSLPPLQASIGKVEFSEHGVNLNGVGASFLDGPLALTGGTQHDGAILIKMAGALSADGLRKTYPAPAMQRLAGHLSGSTRFTGAVSVKDRQLQVNVDSNLAGLGLDFPAPARKAAADSLPLRFVLNGAPAAANGTARDEIKLALGATMAARYERQRLPGGSWTVLRGGVGVNVPAPEPDSGMMINVSLKTLNVDQWLAVGSEIAGPHSDASLAATAARPGVVSTDPDLGQYIVPDIMAARASELIIGDRKLDNVVVGATHQKGAWQANIDARQASGYVTWNESGTGQGLGKVTARLSSLIIPQSAEADVKDLLESGKSAAATIPALDIIADHFELFNKQLGRLELSASNAQAVAGREWRINKLTLANPDGDFKAAGKWVTKDGKSSTVLNFTLDMADAGRLLDRFGFPETLRGGKGKIAGDIAWSGLPYTMDLPSLSGQIQLNVEAGQFLKQDPGAAKLLGVLSLQALPRLLKLDFHDVFAQGLAFDGITASAIITHGVLKTDNLKMHGVAATVLMDGTADIANESSNLHVVVIPEFNLGTGPLVYALAVNPVIGLGSFLAQLFLRAPVMKALTYQLQITGPWKAPVITRLEHDKPAPLATNR
jgi:uncharacterized protein (TIGR02099 family)